MWLFFLMLRQPRRSTLFPYTTLFRSQPLRNRPRLVFERSGLGDCFPGEDEPPLVGPAVDILGTIFAPRLGADFVDQHRHTHRSEEHTSELQSRQYLVCRLLLEK